MNSEIAAIYILRRKVIEDFKESLKSVPREERRAVLDQMIRMYDQCGEVARRELDV
jgi:hypothetical protein